MARLQLVPANKEAKAPRVRTSAKTVTPINDDQKDHFITRNGLTYAGSHLIIDLWEAEGLDDRDRIEKALIDAVNAAGATLLHIHLHTFSRRRRHIWCCRARGEPYQRPYLARKGLCRL